MCRMQPFKTLVFCSVVTLIYASSSDREGSQCVLTKGVPYCHGIYTTAPENLTMFVSKINSLNNRDLAAKFGGKLFSL